MVLKPWFKPSLFILCLLPLVWLVLGLIQDRYVEPLQALSHGTGDWALYFLLLTLSITPLRQLTGYTQLLRIRRLLGLFAFFYSLVHVLLWLVFDHSLFWQGMWADIIERPYITVGFLAFILMLPLALTSNRFMIKKLGGKRWQQLHRLTYVVCALGLLHYWWQIKYDMSHILLLTLIFVGLMALRRIKLTK